MDSFRCRVNGIWYTVELSNGAVVSAVPLPKGQADYCEGRLNFKAGYNHTEPPRGNLVVQFRHGMKFDPLASIGITAEQILEAAK